MSSSFGRLFRLTSWGESHGPALGGTIDGCPAGLELAAEDIQVELDRRRPGQSRITTPRREADKVELLSGVFQGRTTGAPIAFHVKNGDVDSSKYDNLKRLYRPSHADWTWQAKFGRRDYRGGGRASARETLSRVAAGAVAQKLLRETWGVEVVAWVSQIQELCADVDPLSVQRAEVDANPVRCPDTKVAAEMQTRIEDIRRDRDSVGGIVECVIRGVPPGWGEPTFDRFEALLAHAMLSIPACKGFDSGAGFRSLMMRGSQHNDPFYMDGERVRTRTNNSGGVQGGISNGENITMRAVFKPVATIFKEQHSVTEAGEEITFKAIGRHDPCVLPRAVPIVEAMAALVTADLALMHNSRG